MCIIEALFLIFFKKKDLFEIHHPFFSSKQLSAEKK